MTSPAIRQDAKSRAARTFLQGLGIDVAVGVAVALLAWLPQADLSSSDAWKLFGLSVAKTVLTAAASYVMRLKLAPPAPVDGPVDPVTPAEGD